jgi:predicted transcriptional regulator YdeE
MIRQLSPFRIIGIHVRTTNLAGRARQDIAGLWERFFAEAVRDRISGKETKDIYSLYTDYASDHQGPYTTMMGCRVNGEAEIPQALSERIVPGGKYRCFTSRDKLSETVPGTWKAIWEEGFPRSYRADFDLYPANPPDPVHPEAETYVSIP